MIIQMTQTRRGSEDGFVVRCFYTGFYYDIADTLARAFINAGCAFEPSLIHNSKLRIPPMAYNRLLARVSAPATEPLTLNETKLYLRIDHDYEDTLISDLVVTARMAAENWLRRSLISQAWKLGYDECVPAKIDLPMGPVNTITSVTIINRDNGTSVVSDDCYSLNSARNLLRFDIPLHGFHIEIVYNTGYGATGAEVPAPIRQGMLSHIATLYDGRGEVSTAMPDQAFSLYMPFREIML